MQDIEAGGGKEGVVFGHALSLVPCSPRVGEVEVASIVVISGDGICPPEVCGAVGGTSGTLPS